MQNVPNLTDWISAIGLAAGALATFLAVAVALGIAFRDARRVRVERATEAVGQAAMVTADMHGGANVLIVNHGGRPIREPRVSGYEIANSPGLSWQPNVTGGLATNILGPGAEARVLGGFWIETGPGAARAVVDAPPRSDATISINFFDSDGRRWARHGFDMPTLIADGGTP